MGTANVVSTFDPSALYAGNGPYRHRSVVLASGANAVAGVPLKRGTLLGRITAFDKYIVCVKTANDGSQAPVAILATDTDAAAADVRTAAYFEGEFAAEVMTIDPSWTVATLQAAFRQASSTLYARVLGLLG